MALGTAKKRPVVFLGVGVFNTVVDFVFYTFLTSTAFKNGHNIALAGVISGTFGILCAFLTHGFITWRGSQLTHRTLIRFLIITGLGMWVFRPILLSIFINFSGLYHWVEQFLHRFGLYFSYNFVANTGAFALMLAILLLYNYIFYSRFVFKDVGNA